MSDSNMSQQWRVVLARCLQWKKTLIACAVISFMWLVGFGLIVPYALKHILTVTWAKQIDRVVSVSAVRLNPWHWALTIEQFKIADADNTTLVYFESLLVDYDMFSLFRLEYGIDAIEWDKPYFKIAVNEQGELGIQALVPKQQQEKEPSASAPMPAVFIKTINILDAALDYSDLHTPVPIQKKLSPLSLALSDFHTNDLRHGNRIAFEAHDDNEGIVSWEGQVRLVPISIDGKLIISNVGLLPVLDFVQPQRHWVLQSARLDVEAEHHIEVTSPLLLTVKQAKVAVRDIRISDQQQAAPIIDVPAINVAGIDVDLNKQSVIVNSVQLMNGKLQLVMNADGNSNLQQLFATDPVVIDPVVIAPAVADPAVIDPVAIADPSTAAQTISPPPVASKPWQISIEQAGLENFSVNVTDDKMTPPVTMALAPIQLRASNIKPLSAEAMDVQLTVGLPQNSELTWFGKLTPSPLSVTGDLLLKQLPLSLAQPYIDQAASIVISSGTVDANVKLDINQQESLQLSVTGTSAVRDLEVREKSQKKKLLSWNALELSGIDYSLQKNAVTITEVTVTKPYGRFIINADGTTNVQKLLISDTKTTSKKSTVEKKAVATAPAKTKSTRNANASPAFLLAVKHVRVQEGDMGFADMSLTPHFRVAIEKLQGSIDNISTAAGVVTTVDLKGKVDRYAPVTIKGTCDVMGPAPALDMAMSFKNIELTTFTPYSGTYAGFVIDKGQLSLDLNYRLVNNLIEGKNRIVMNQLQLGKKVVNAKASDLPIRLAIALLRDENGVIDLGFEVNGNVNEPSFSIGGLLLKVLGNIVKKAVMAPFSLVAGMAGTADESDLVVFEYGSSDLNEAGEAKVVTVANLLQKREMLRLNIRGNTLPEEDKLALQQQHLAVQLNQKSGVPVSDFLSPSLAVDRGAAAKLVGRLYRKKYSDSLSDLEERIQEDRRAKQQAEDVVAVKQAAYAQAWTRLAEVIPVTDEEMKQLAMDRAGNIKTTLLEKHAIPAHRVFVLDGADDEAKPTSAVVLTLDAQ